MRKYSIVYLPARMAR